MRLQKFLAHAGISSRRKAEIYIKEGRIKINGSIVLHPGTQVDPSTDKVLFDGKPVTGNDIEEKVYLVVNKPKDVITSCSHRDEKLIIDFVDVEQRVYPVGRLDKDSEGLVILTNDGDLHNQLSHPSFNHEKEYIVTCVQPVTDKGLNQMAKGMEIDGVITRKAKVKRLGPKKFNIILKQGLNRQIRKMVGKTGNKVERLLRVRMSNIRLNHLKPGHWRYLTPKEIKTLKSSLHNI